MHREDWTPDGVRLSVEQAVSLPTGDCFHFFGCCLRGELCRIHVPPPGAAASRAARSTCSFRRLVNVDQCTPVTAMSVGRGTAPATRPGSAVRREPRRHGRCSRRSTRSACSARPLHTSPPPEWGEIRAQGRSRRSARARIFACWRISARRCCRTDGLPAFAETLTWRRTGWNCTGGRRIRGSTRTRSSAGTR